MINIQLGWRITQLIRGDLQPPVEHGNFALCEARRCSGHFCRVEGHLSRCETARRVWALSPGSEHVVALKSQVFSKFQLKNGYGSIPINTIFRGMNIHLPAILMWTTGVQGFDTSPNVEKLKKKASNLGTILLRNLDFSSDTLNWAEVSTVLFEYVDWPLLGKKDFSWPKPQLRQFWHILTIPVYSSALLSRFWLFWWATAVEFVRGTSHPLIIDHRIGWWENLQESPIFDGKNHGFL